MRSDLKYKRILERLAIEVAAGKPGERLGSIRAMMAKFNTSQSVIDRCLDELEREGRIRRKHRSGIYVAGSQPRSKLIGVYTHGEVAPYSNFLFLSGIRSVANERGYQVADFGPEDRFQKQSEVLSELEDMGFAGIITAVSTANFVSLESRARVEAFRHLEIPLVSCFPIPSIATDSVMPDYYAAFRKLGGQIRDKVRQPVKFIGHAGIPTLTRLQGLEVGLTSEIPIDLEILDGKVVHAFSRVRELVEERWKGSLVIGVPPDKPGVVEELAGSRWIRRSQFTLALTFEDGDELPDGICAYKVIRPSFSMGAKAAEMLIERILGFRGEARYEIIEHRILPP